MNFTKSLCGFGWIVVSVCKTESAQWWVFYRSSMFYCSLCGFGSRLAGLISPSLEILYLPALYPSNVSMFCSTHFHFFEIFFS